MADGAAARRRLGVRVTGAVQGVGFRPFVHRLATVYGLSGFVQNDADGVWIEIEGEAVDAFVVGLGTQAPPLARIETVATSPLRLRGDLAFEVAATAAGGARSARIPPDAGICRACVDELFSPADRRRHYPFIACCDCGPRFTMTRALPYDRPQTAMAGFPLCAACEDDYRNPASRRFHAEPTACAACGPRYAEDAASILARMKRGEIVAVKGVGGFHLMCDARQPAVVDRLRQRKERSGKPFAVLAANAASVRQFAEASAAEAALLESPARPIVLLQTRSPHPEHLAPGLDTIGVMLPSTGFHWLLFHAAAGAPQDNSWIDAAQEALFIATSANPGGEPLVVDVATARTRLAGIADAVIDHDRAIIVRADDAVARVIAGAPVYLRRGRGLAPDPIKLPRAVPSTIAFGAHLKAAVCVTRGDEAFLAQHVGDLDDPETRRFHAETAAHLLAILNVKPERAACDLHPDFASTFAAERTGLPLWRVQHHHAHAAACAAENAALGPYLALTLDGFGFGPHGEAWGGELLLVNDGGYRRVGGLAPLPLPGGDEAARAPWRMAAAVLAVLGRGREIAARFGAEPLAAPIAQCLAARRFGATSSAGRYFDAAAGLLGICPNQAYEAEAAMRLEALADGGVEPRSLWRITNDTLDLRAVFEALLDCDAEEGGGLFHRELADGLAALAFSAAAAHGVTRVALTGGCFANRLLTEHLSRALESSGLTPMRHRLCPPGDGGLALGQAWIAALKEGG
jgi:hydrogenase maturation protein HypF